MTEFGQILDEIKFRLNQLYQTSVVANLVEFEQISLGVDESKYIQIEAKFRSGSTRSNMTKFH